MKVGTTASPWRYDGGTDQAMRPDSLRWPAILRYASWRSSSNFAGLPVAASTNGNSERFRDWRGGPKQTDVAKLAATAGRIWLFGGPLLPIPTEPRPPCHPPAPLLEL
jgi:hypothetical protein